MRHNQNARRSQRGGRGNGGGNYNGGGNHNNHHRHDGGQRRVNPRIQTFDSNGPDVRIRGTAFQILEKYTALARDAASAGDRVLAESYLQHAEHYQRFINEATEEFNQYQQQQQAQHQSQQPQPHIDGAAQPAPAVEGENMSDLDQGFLHAPRHGQRQQQQQNNGTGEQPAVAVIDPAQQEQPRPQRQQRRNSEAETA